jgi:hypothetical protein
MTTRPDRTEAAAYYFTYIDQVPDGAATSPGTVDICGHVAHHVRIVNDRY